MKLLEILGIKVGCDLYFMSGLPKTYAQFKNNYIFIKNDKTSALFYIKPNGSYEKVTITDFDSFEKQINAIKTKDQTQLHLNEQQIQDIVTSNGGHGDALLAKKINANYKQKTLENHPDKNGSRDTKEIKTIKEVYELLKDARYREYYIANHAQIDPHFGENNYDEIIKEHITSRVDVKHRDPAPYIKKAQLVVSQQNIKPNKNGLHTIAKLLTQHDDAVIPQALFEDVDTEDRESVVLAYYKELEQRKNYIQAVYQRAQQVFAQQNIQSSQYSTKDIDKQNLANISRLINQLSNKNYGNALQQLFASLNQEQKEDLIFAYSDELNQNKIFIQQKLAAPYLYAVKGVLHQKNITYDQNGLKIISELIAQVSQYGSNAIPQELCNNVRADEIENLVFAYYNELNQRKNYIQFIYHRAQQLFAQQNIRPDKNGLKIISELIDQTSQGNYRNTHLNLVNDLAEPQKNHLKSAYNEVLKQRKDYIEFIYQKANEVLNSQNYQCNQNELIRITQLIDQITKDDFSGIPQALLVNVNEQSKKQMIDAFQDLLREHKIMLETELRRNEQQRRQEQEQEQEQEQQRQAEQQRRQEQEQQSQAEQQPKDTEQQRREKQQNNKDQEQTQKAQEQQQKDQEQQQKTQEQQQKTQEQQQKTQEQQQKAQEQQQKAQQQQQKAQEQQQKAQQQQQKDQEQQQKAQEQQQKAQEQQQKEQQQQQKEQQQQQKEQQQQQKAQEQQQKAQEQQQKAQEQKQKTQEQQQKAQEQKQKDQEQQQKAQEQKQKDQEQKQKDQEQTQKDQEQKQKDQELQRREEQLRKNEEQRRDEQRRQEEQQRREEQQRNEEQQGRRIFITSTDQKIDNILNELTQKIGGIDQHYFNEAQNTAEHLLKALQIAKNNYLIQLHNNVEDADKNFENACKNAIDWAKPILERDLGWGTYLTNVLKAITNAIIWVVSFGQANNFFKQTRSESIKTVEEVEQKLTTGL
jgi:hypothetical protein